MGVLGVSAALAVSRARPRTAEDVAIDEALANRRAGGDALGPLLRCASKRPDACRCSEAAAELAIDINQYPAARVAIEMTPACPPSPRHLGERAEVAVAEGRTDEGRRLADQALGEDPHEPHACFAKAWALNATESSPAALDAAECAVRGGRGAPALLVLAVLRSRANDRAGARDALQKAAVLAPGDAHVAFDLGVIEAQDQHYREAREAFLHALALDPKLADARYELVVLTHGAKADDEARHHLDELAAIAPDDPRLADLRAALARGGPKAQAPAGGSTAVPTGPAFVRK